MEKNSKIYIAGHRGMAGSAICRRLETEGYTNIVTRTSKELDLRNQSAVHEFFESEKPEYVFLCAAKVGGIQANNIYRADFIYENLIIEANVIHQAHESKVKKLLFLGSSCIYPRESPQPIKEEYLLTSPLEPTNEPYAIAKIAGLKMCESYRLQYGDNFISVMPTNLYGTNDNYNLENSHVFAALVRKFVEAKKENKPFVEIWGTGTPRREFLHADDLASACVFLMNNYNSEQWINIGTGKDISIKELAEMIGSAVQYEGALKFNTSKPDGTFLKRLDTTKINNLGWFPTVSLKEGVNKTVQEYLTIDNG